MRYLSVLSGLLFLLAPLRAQININANAVEKAVVFLYASKDSGEVNPEKPIGTAFLVEVPLLSQPQKAYKLLVTARHMVDPQWALCKYPNPARIYVRLNKKDYSPADAEGVGYIPLSVTENQAPAWKFHDDSQVDVAVTVLVAPILQSYELDAIPLSVFATGEELHTLAVGSSIVSAGLIPGASGKKRNHPIFKFGYLSSIPDEPIDAGCDQGGPTQPRKVWLVAANLVPGNSGSPIFAVPAGGAGVSFGGGRAMLVGVQSISISSADVAGMTPANYIFDVIEKLDLRDANLKRGEPDKPKAAP